MAAYSSEKCWQLWKQETLTVEQAIGQLLQLVAVLEAQVKELEQRLRALEAARQA